MQIISICLVFLLACRPGDTPARAQEADPVIPGAARFGEYLPQLDGKAVGLVVNPTSRVGQTHLVDTLLSLGVNIQRIFGPEHGFRGTAGAGEHVASGTDEKTGLPVVSLYGSHRKPTPEDLAGLDILVFDIQDVGVRFYTYLSTMTYVMEACAQNGIPLVILDRPNPNGHYVDGPVMEDECTSFIGLHAGIPLVHGMTPGEYALMLNGEGWLQGGMECELFVIPCANYTHETRYDLPVKPSPNLPNMQSVYLYPSLGLFEQTTASTGRGTDKPFQVFGHPALKGYPYKFRPEPMPGALHPKFAGKTCYGLDLSGLDTDSLWNARQINLSWLLRVYRDLPRGETFFLPHFYLVAGNHLLRKQIESNMSESQIRASWQEGISRFKTIRKKYLLYPDFE